MDKTPFYKAYPLQDFYREGMEQQMELQKMKELYPKEVQQIQQMIEQRLDELEYEGSRIYDENPDRRMLELEAQQIYGKLHCNDWLCTLIQVLFDQEVYCRRCRNRRW